MGPTFSRWETRLNLSNLHLMRDFYVIKKVACPRIVYILQVYLVVVLNIHVYLFSKIYAFPIHI